MKPPLVSREIVEDTIGAFDTASPEELAGWRAQCGSFQEELSAFVLVYTEGLPDRERALALAVYTLMVKAFRRSGATFRKVRNGEVIHAWKSSAAFIRDLRSERPAPAIAEPEVLLLILDMLLGENAPQGSMRRPHPSSQCECSRSRPIASTGRVCCPQRGGDLAHFPFAAPLVLHQCRGSHIP
jgi:hypothetical protein